MLESGSSDASCDSSGSLSAASAPPFFARDTAALIWRRTSRSDGDVGGLGISDLGSGEDARAAAALDEEAVEGGGGDAARMANKAAA